MERKFRFRSRKSNQFKSEKFACGTPGWQIIFVQPFMIYLNVPIAAKRNTIPEKKMMKIVIELNCVRLALISCLCHYGNYHAGCCVACSCPLFVRIVATLTINIWRSAFTLFLPQRITKRNTQLKFVPNHIWVRQFCKHSHYRVVLDCLRFWNVCDSAYLRKTTIILFSVSLQPYFS